MDVPQAVASADPPFVFTFVRSPASHYASGLGQASMHFYGPWRDCYAYGHRCTWGTGPYKVARKNKQKAADEGEALGPTQARVSRWLKAVTYESGGAGKTFDGKRGAASASARVGEGFVASARVEGGTCRLGARRGEAPKTGPRSQVPQPPHGPHDEAPPPLRRGL